MLGGGGPTGTDGSGDAHACPAASAAGRGSLRRSLRGWKAGPAGVAAGAHFGLKGWPYARAAWMSS